MRVRRFGCVALVPLIVVLIGLTPPICSEVVQRTDATSGLESISGPAKSLGTTVIERPALLPHGARQLGPLSPSHLLQIAFAMNPAHAGALANAAREVSIPGSPIFHRFLSPAEVARRFGPTASTIARVTHEITALGLKVGKISSNHLLLHASATVGLLSSSLRARLDTVRFGDGRLGWRLTSNALLPARFANGISAVIGLNNVAVAHSMLGLRKSPSANLDAGAVGLTRARPSACPSATAAAHLSGGWTLSQIASAYGISPLYAAHDVAAGQTIAVVELEPFVKSDIATFDRCYFGESHVNLIHRVPIDGFAYRGSGSGESVLDIESLSALAPAATIDVYEAPNTTIGTLDTYNTIVGSDSANLITTSWGECEQLFDATSPGARQVENFIFEEAAAQGQTVIAATGDSGSDDCATTPFGSDSPVAPFLSVDDPASQPYVLGVGGTSLRSDIQPLGPLNEIAWNNGSQGGSGGGGVSVNWSSPSWQQGSGVPGVSTTLGRQVPDVSASADSVLGMTVYSASFGRAGWTTIGGTSAAAPIWAAVLAEIAGSGSAGTACTSLGSSPGGMDLGFVPPLLYAAAATSYATNFHEISVGTNDAFSLGLGYRASSGYNMVGGLGSPIVTNPGDLPGLASTLCNEATQSLSPSVARPVPMGISPGYGPLGGGTVVTISLSQPLAAGAAVTVTFNGVVALVNSVGATAISVVSPPARTTPETPPFSAAGPAAVSVTQTTTAGSATSIANSSMVFEYVGVSGTGTDPIVSGVNPSAGNQAGGNRISIYGSGFSSATPTVIIGGQLATSILVVSDFHLVASVPPETGASSCATGPGYSPATLCQTQVVVSDANGTSSGAPILPVLTGRLTYSPLGMVTTSGSTEVAPATTEYDYAPTPSIVAIEPSYLPQGGRTMLRIIGRGFSLNTLDWVNFGSPDRIDSQQLKFSAISDNEIDLKGPALHRRAGQVAKELVTVQSAAGLSRPRSISFLGVPSVARLSSSGGTPLGGRFVKVIGAGFLGVTSARFVSVLNPTFSVTVSGRSLRKIRSTSFLVRVPRARAGPFVIEPCNESRCASFDEATATYVYFSRAGPFISHVTFSAVVGSQSSMVALFGSDLAGARAVMIGSYRATQFVSSGTVPVGDPKVAMVVVPRTIAIPGAGVVIETRAGQSERGITLR